MIAFTRLRLSGFKSFVEACDLAIEPGLTGVVGPNGCGKSNLVEALRWVMGETSARQMRGGEMEDVIFGGTAERPPRNIAEVALVLDNAGRAAPVQFNAHDELEVVRRIERGAGSLYRVNGKEVRARDVQLLFADAATGARSTAMVSQGRVAALISAKPSDRRGLLEEAAGISGLHSRRHEAELRLKAAETNLARLDDVLATLDSQLGGLRRQARQAARYRDLAERIRALEALSLHAAWLDALAAMDEARAGRKAAEALVADTAGQAAAAAAAQAEAAAALAPLRLAEAEAAAACQRLAAARERLDADEAAAARRRSELQQRLAQIGADFEREKARGTDAEQALARLEAERATIAAARQGEAEAEALAGARFAEARARADAAEAELAALTEAVAAAEAARSAAQRRLDEAGTRHQRQAGRLDEIAEQRRRAAADGVAEEEMEAAALRLEECLERQEAARGAVDQADHRRRLAQAARDAARDSLQNAAAARAGLRAEIHALTELLAQESGGGAHPAVLEAIGVEPGWEAALAAALGDDLSAPAVDGPAPLRWLTLPPLPDAAPLPAGAEPLAAHVEAPRALTRRLAQTGVVAQANGAALRHDLRPGQRLVSREGDLWRWDGFTVAAGAPSAAAVRLRQRNRLAELRARQDDAEMAVDAAEKGEAAAAAAAGAASAGEARAREAVRRAEGDTQAARDAHQRLAHKAQAAALRLAALDEAVTRAGTDLAEAAAAEAAARAALAELSDESAGRARLAELRAAAAEGRAELVEARSLLDRLAREAGDRRRRLDALAGEAVSWAGRRAAALAQQEELAERRGAARDEMERQAALPLEIAEQRQILLERLHAADAARAGAARALAAAEHRQTEADRALRAAEQAAASAREERVRREAAVEAMQAACRAVAARIAERLDASPEQLGRSLEGVERPPPDDIQRRLSRLTAEREGMGPVNLRAEIEVVEIETRIATLTAERDDLTAAIARLRQGIAQLEREGRERLLASFREVDRHFRDLFARLFGGGRAHLALTESDDPLGAGLEIMASPPGKRLQVLSLLSGGEQALTALALLFAVFMTNPAPICVLDEVDAPLDDANVDRFCTLVEEIARASATRFLVVTHHRMTMARMDRLFGVTMTERGVSQLVSVDLAAAERLRDTA